MCVQCAAVAFSSLGRQAAADALMASAQPALQQATLGTKQRGLAANLPSRLAGAAAATVLQCSKGWCDLRAGLTQANLMAPNSCAPIMGHALLHAHRNAHPMLLKRGSLGRGRGGGLHSRGTERGRPWVSKVPGLPGRGAQERVLGGSRMGMANQGKTSWRGGRAGLLFEGPRLGKKWGRSRASSGWVRLSARLPHLYSV